ncbi:hypothetical protein PV326_005276 [Microctonus aethiopoides]|nr:hypothetical protein PV326_005276 [Microctonus aethiopoides]
MRLCLGDSPPGPSMDQEEKCTESGGEKPKVRYTGARRRYKKEQKKLGAKQAQAATAPVLEGGASDSRVQEGKRPAPEHDRPSPQYRRPDERSKIACGTYAQAATKIVRWALVPEDYPDQKLTPEDAGGLKGLLRTLILSIPWRAMAPTFEGAWERDGAVIVGCSNEKSGMWLKSLFPDNKIGGKTHVLSPEELPKRHKVVVHVEEGISTKEATTLTDKQNPPKFRPKFKGLDFG